MSCFCEWIWVPEAVCPVKFLSTQCLCILSPFVFRCLAWLLHQPRASILLSLWCSSEARCCLLPFFLLVCVWIYICFPFDFSIPPCPSLPVLQDFLITCLKNFICLFFVIPINLDSVSIICKISVFVLLFIILFDGFFRHIILKCIRMCGNIFSSVTGICSDIANKFLGSKYILIFDEILMLLSFNIFITMACRCNLSFFTVTATYTDGLFVLQFSE